MSDKARQVLSTLITRTLMTHDTLSVVDSREYNTSTELIIDHINGQRLRVTIRPEWRGLDER